MNSLFKFEFKRVVHSKVLVMTVVLCVVIGGLGMVLNHVFYGSEGVGQQCLVSVFNSYTQFTYFILGFVFVQSFTKDYAGGITSFYKQLGYSLTKQNICKAIVMMVITIPIIDLLVLICSILYKNSDVEFLFAIIIAINLSTLYIVLLALFISTIFKHTVRAVLCFYGVFVIFNILNLFMYGMINPADGNSIVTYCVTEWSGRHMSHHSIDKLDIDLLKFKEYICVLLPMIWCVVLGLGDTYILRKNDKKI